jgi:hypothetical protein
MSGRDWCGGVRGQRYYIVESETLNIEYLTSHFPSTVTLLADRAASTPLWYQDALTPQSAPVTPVQGMVAGLWTHWTAAVLLLSYAE